jgi:hypothetical protein
MLVTNRRVLNFGRHLPEPVPNQRSLAIDLEWAERRDMLVEVSCAEAEIGELIEDGVVRATDAPVAREDEAQSR